MKTEMIPKIVGLLFVTIFFVFKIQNQLKLQEKIILHFIVHTHIGYTNFQNTFSVQTANLEGNPDDLCEYQQS